MMKKLFAGLAVIGALASVVAGRERTPDAAPEVLASIDRNVSGRGVSDPAPQAEIDVDRLKREPAQASSVDPFAPKSFAPPAPKLAPAAPMKPVAPALPFTYLGKVIDAGKTVVFVARADENYSLEAGQTIGNQYRVEAITDTAVTFTYLPMKTRQTLQIPASE